MFSMCESVYLSRRPQVKLLQVLSCDFRLVANLERQLHRGGHLRRHHHHHHHHNGRHRHLLQHYGQTTTTTTSFIASAALLIALSNQPKLRPRQVNTNSTELDILLQTRDKILRLMI